MQAGQDTQNIIGTFFEKGKLLTPEALQYLESKNIKGFLSESYGLVVDLEDLLAREDKIRIVRNITEIKKEVTTADVVKFYNSKYEKMKNIILSRLRKDFISINKLDTYKSEVFIIGIVKDIRDSEGRRDADLEDPTGSITVTFDAKDAEALELDDVIAVEGVSSGAALLGKKILYPDMPLRQPARGSGKACFISDLHLEEAPKQDLERFLQWFGLQDIKYLFVTGCIGDRAAFESLAGMYCTAKKIFAAATGHGGNMPHLPQDFRLPNIISLSNPSIVELNGITILLLRDFDNRMLRKRHMGNIKPVLTEDAMALEELPDIVHCSGEASVTNYKSVTIVNPGSMLAAFRPVVVDFSTRECVQVNMETL